MSTASPTAYLLWAILSVLFLAFLIYHLWSYDRFKCLHWSSGRQPGAFKRVMTYSYLGSVPLFVIYSIATTVIKFKEGWLVLPDNHIISKPLDMYAPPNRHWIVPLGFVFSFAWGLELITHLEELAFWMYLLHQHPQKAEWFESWEYRMWYMGSMIAFVGMPLTALIARRDVITLDAYIFLVGSSGSTGTTLLFLYVLWNFPKFLKHVKAEGADPSVVVRLTTFYQLNLGRVVFRFLFTVPLLIVAVDGLVGTAHRINRSVFWTDFLLMIAGIGCFVSTTITLLIFFPRSFTVEAGYKPKAPTSAGPESPKSQPVTPPSLNSRSRQWAEWNAQLSSPVDSHWGSAYYADESRVAEDDEQQQVPPYAHAEVHHRQPFPHALSSPYIPSLGSPASPVSPAPSWAPAKRHSRRESAREGQSPAVVYPHEGSTPSLVKPGDVPSELALRGTPSHAPRPRRGEHRRASSSLHPYVMTFTSPIDLADLQATQDLPRTTI